ncbi:hypothetical protein Acr_11g0005630 [Actinidia rufa]|uniref:Uncharacterized protein n=1 Tax=Actinidia rufa TaxID=165716 RepID=A0A7J0FEA6_9ERIC|nr:hypothetical protein Acr_11g0005630 [Actinidia rufa]
MLLCVEGAGREGYEFGGSAMVLVRAPRDLTESELELVALDVTGDWSLGTIIGLKAKFESPESHWSDFGGERKPISNSDQIRSAQKMKCLISTEKPFLSFLGIPNSSARITPYEKSRMKDTERDEQEDDWANQTMHWTRDQVEGDVPREDISEQSLNEEACVEASERDYSGGINERVPESHMKRSKEETREEVSRRRSQMSGEEVKEEIPADDG